MTEYVILVDENDNEIGSEEKLAAHEKGLLHRAISVVLFDRDNPERVLIQQRAACKYHSPLLWGNAACSHPRHGEATLAAANRRLFEELGITELPELHFAGSFLYRDPVGALVEHEFDHIFVGFIARDMSIPLNPKEVAQVVWVGAEELLEGDFIHKSRKYVPWLNKVLYKALSAGFAPVHHEIVKKYKVAA